MKYGRIIEKERVKFFEVAENIFAAISPYHGICWANAGFINRGDGLVFDTFFDTFHAEEMKEVYQEVSGKENPAYLVNSHYNCDHTWGNKVFKDSCVIMHKAVAEECKTEPYDYWNDIVTLDRESETATKGQLFLNEELEGFDLSEVEWITPDIEIDSDITIHLDDTIVEIINVAPAHSNSDVIMWLPKEKVLFAGDVVFNGCSAYSEAGVNNWVKVLDYIIDELKPEVVVPGHGAICDLSFVKEQRNYLLNLIEGFKQHYTPTITTLELAKQMDFSDYLHWIAPERIYASLDALVKGERNIQEPVDWDVLTENLVSLRSHLESKYGDRLEPWDPYYNWKEN